MKERRKADKKPAEDSGMVQEGGWRTEESPRRWEDRSGVREA